MNCLTESTETSNALELCLCYAFNTQRASHCFLFASSGSYDCKAWMPSGCFESSPQCDVFCYRSSNHDVSIFCKQRGIIVLALFVFMLGLEVDGFKDLDMIHLGAFQCQKF